MTLSDTKLTELHIATFKDAAKKLTGYDRRAFQAQVAINYLNSSSRQAEKVFGWGRDTVELGLNELRSGMRCIDNYQARGDKRIEVKNQQLEIDICDLADPESQIDPKFQTLFKYTRITAKAMRAALIREKGWKDTNLPCEKTIGNIMNRLNYRLRRVQKSKPLKKVTETDGIFTKLAEINKASDLRADSLRISIDSKAKVDLGNLSRGGTSRCKINVKADDHDLGDKEKLVPFGILNVMTGLLTLIFGVSSETSDFIVDCLQQWWDDNKTIYAHITQLVINLDCGPQNSSHRTQFMKRMIEFADKNNLEIVLAYYPPYHSKYNPIERCWSALERHWNATLLHSLFITLAWAKTMTWKSIHPMIGLIDKVYQKGVKLTKKVFETLSHRLDRDEVLSKYFVTIKPQPQCT